MNAIYTHIARLRHAGRTFGLATVVRTSGSTPQAVGAKLVVDDLDTSFGTLGGGCVEADAIIALRELLAGGAPMSLRAHELNEDLAWNTGLVCGGTMWILVESSESALTCAGQDMLSELVAATYGGPPLAVVTRLTRDGQQLKFAGRMFVGEDSYAIGSLNDAALDAKVIALATQQLPHGTAKHLILDDSTELLIDAVAAPPRLIVAGGGHVALAIAQQAQLLKFEVTIAEDRPDYADPNRFPGATVLAGPIAETIASLDYGWNSFIVVATRGHKLDADCVLAAMKTNARYVGLLGSRRKIVLLQKMLAEEGISAERAKTVRSPVGLDLGGRSPAEIALAVLAEITMMRYQASGKPLSSEVSS